MVLDAKSLPPELRHFSMLRESVLDNRTMAEQGFPGNSAERLRELGRVTGYLRELGNMPPGSEVKEGIDLAAATVAHLFESEAAVATWMTDVFVRQFEEHAGKVLSPSQELVSVDRLEVAGFADRTIALRALQRGPLGLISSTVVDFRVGRLLGVAYVVTIGDAARLDLAQAMGRTLEKQMVRVVLGAA